MKPTRAATIIFRKELVDTLRDRRTVAMMVLVPMVVYPLTLLLASEAMIEAPASEAPPVSVVTLKGVPPKVLDVLREHKGISLDAKDVDPAPATPALERARVDVLLKEGDADIVLASAATSAAALDALESAQLRMYYDGTSPRAEIKRGVVEDILTDLAQRTTQDRLDRVGVPTSAIQPIVLRTRSIASAEKKGNQLLGLMLPTLVLTFIAISCFYPAVDLTAGEKERKTLATLLCAPVRVTDIVVGKYLAVLTVGSMAGLLNVVVLLVTLLRLIAGTEAGAATRFDLSPLMVLGLLGAIVAVAAPIAAIMLGAASLARSFRDASALLTPVLLVCLLPIGATMSPDARLTPGMGAVPLAGAALLMRALLHGEATLLDIFRVLAASAAMTGVMLFLVTRIFADERALFATEGRRADLRGLFASPPPIGLSTGVALAGVVFVAHYYGGLLSLALPAVLAVPLIQVIAQLVPVALLAAWLLPRIAPRRLLLLYRPPPRALLAAGILGATAWLGLSLPGGWTMELLLPGHVEAMKQFAKSLELGSSSLPVTILAFAIVPALIEELTFRGALLSLFSARLSPAGAILSQALIFGALHGSLFRMLPTGLLGVLLGVVAKRSGSIVPGMVIHACTNAILLGIDRLGGESAALHFGSPTPLALVGVLGVALGLFVLGPGESTSPVAVERKAE